MNANDLTLAADLAMLKNIALLVFLLLWLGIVLRLVLSHSGAYREAAQIPLTDEPNEALPAHHAEADDA
jgi:hypothetical protein